MRLLKNKYLVKEIDQLKSHGQLVLFSQEEASDYTEAKVLAVSDEEEEIEVGEIITIKKDAGQAVDLGGNKIVKRQEVIRIK